MLFSKGVKISHLPFYYDIHSHILPKVDDGVRNEKDAYRILRNYQEDGIKHVVLTPHINPETYPNNDAFFLKEEYKSFKEGLPEDITLQLHLGAEYMCNETLNNERDFLTIGKNGIVLNPNNRVFFKFISIITIGDALSGAFCPCRMANPERLLVY